MDDYSNPPSVASSITPGNNTKKTVLRIEKSKKGQIDVKVGQKIWDGFPLDIRDDLSMLMDMDGEHSEGGGKGDTVYNEVKEFCELKSEPNVKRMRSTIPKAVLLLFHTESVIEGREKIRDMWIAAKRPECWPKNVPFVDPNNGNKLPKTELMKVFEFLRSYFKEHERQLHRDLGLDVQRAEQQRPGHQKAMTHVKRAVREIEHLMKKLHLAPQAHRALFDLKYLLEDIHIKNDKDVLRVFDTASAVQRLTLEMEVTNKTSADVYADCQGIQDRYIKQEDKCLVQPTSADVGQQYVESMESYVQTTKPEVDEVYYKDEKVFTKLDAAPGFTMQTSTSAALDATTTSPQLGFMDTSPFDQPNSPFYAVQCHSEEEDLLTQICKDLELDSSDDHLPQKKMKIEPDIHDMDLRNTTLNAISVQELGSSSMIDNSEQHILLQLTANPVIQTVLDQYQQQSQEKKVANVILAPNPNIQVTNFSWDKSNLQYFGQPTSPGTQIMAAEAPSTMIPTMVEGMEFE